MRFEGTDRYEVRRRLGFGGSGDVYEVLDQTLDRRIALKVLRDVTPERLLRFKDEFRALADLRHPNLVALYDLEVADGRWFFTMELVDGVDLLAHVRPEGVLTETRLRAVTGQLVAALGFLHQSGRVHRDIKPSNLMVERGGRLVVLDFGLAAHAPRPTAETVSGLGVSGTPAYMSPEQADADVVTYQSDWYAVGAVLYQVLFSRLPFEGSPIKVLLDKRRQDPLIPDVPGLPRDVVETCRGLLARDPAARPTFETLALRFPRSDTGAPRPLLTRPFVGRRAELTGLVDLFERRDAEITVAHVMGVSGVGKSALLERFADEMRGRATILRGRCYEREAVPYKALDQLCDSLASLLRRATAERAAALLPRDIGPLVELFPVLERVPCVAEAPHHDRSGGGQALRLRAFSALRELLYRLADREPLVLLLEDLQWGDDDSADLLAHILRGEHAPALLVVGTYRGDEIETSRFVSRFREMHPFEEVKLTALEAVDARALLSALIESVDERVADEVVRESAGHPLFLLELARHIVAVAGGTARDSTELTYAAVLDARVRRLDAAQRRLLSAIVVAGGPVASEVACAAAEADSDAVEGLRREALARVLADGQLEVYHDMLRAELGRRLETRERAETHRRLGEALLATEAPEIDRVAHHLDAGGDSETAAPLLLEAGDRTARALAFGHAADLYERAIALGCDRRADGRSVWAMRAEALSLAGQTLQSGQTFLVAAEHVEPDRALPLRERAVDELLSGGHVPECEAALKQTLEAAGLRSPRTFPGSVLALLWARLRLKIRGTRLGRVPRPEVARRARMRADVAWTVAHGYAFIDLVRAFTFHTRSELFALQAADRMRVCRTVFGEAGLHAAASATARAEACVERGVALLRPGDPPRVRVMELLARTWTTTLGGRFLEGTRHADSVAEFMGGVSGGWSWELHHAAAWRLEGLYWSGDLAAVVRDSAKESETARVVGSLAREATFMLEVPTPWRLIIDQPVRASADVEEMLRRVAAAGLHDYTLQGHIARTSVHLYRGEWDGAWAEVCGTARAYRWAIALHTTTLRLPFRELHARCALAAMARGMLGRRGRRRVHASLRSLRRDRKPWTSALAALLEAQVRALDGGTADFAKAERAVRDAGLAAHAEAARWRAAQELGADPVPALEALERLGAVSPETYARLLVPVGPATG